VIETERLLIRRWQARDCAPFAALNADPEDGALPEARLPRGIRGGVGPMRMVVPGVGAAGLAAANGAP